MTTSRRGRVIRAVISVVIVVGIFVGVLPRIADMGDVWRAVTEMTWLEVATLIAAAAWNIVTYFTVIVAAMPGLTMPKAAVMSMSSTAIANTLPAGGALGVGVTYAMFTSWGFSRGDIGRYVIVTGIANTFVKLGMPVLALALVAIGGDTPAPLIVAAAVGVGALVVSIVALVLVLRSERLARRVGGWMQRPVDFVRRLFRQEPAADLGDAATRFRSETHDLLARRWLALTTTTIVSHLSLFVVLLVALRHVGIDENELGVVRAFAAFALIRLVSALPITPGGVGVVELGLIGALVTAGGARAPVVAAVLVYRALTYLLPIPIGAATYVVWRRASGWRADAADPQQSVSGQSGGT